MKPQPVPIPLGLPMPGIIYTAGWFEDGPVPDYILKRCPLGVPGDRLWVRETWHSCPHCHDIVAYRAGGWMTTVDGEIDTEDVRPLPRKCSAHGWKPSIHMPRRFSRITLEIVAVRVERVQEITEQDAVAEGAAFMPAADLRDERLTVPQLVFSHVWDSLYSKRGLGWDANPWVWVIEFAEATPR